MSSSVSTILIATIVVALCAGAAVLPAILEAEDEGTEVYSAVDSGMMTTALEGNTFGMPGMNMPEMPQNGMNDSTMPAMPGEMNDNNMPEMNNGTMPMMPGQDGMVPGNMPMMPEMNNGEMPENMAAQSNMPPMPPQMNGNNMPGMNNGTMPGMNNGTMPGIPGQNDSTMPQMNDGNMPMMPGQDGSNQSTMPAMPGMQNGTQPQMPQGTTDQSNMPPMPPQMNGNNMPGMQQGNMPQMNGGNMPMMPGQNGMDQSTMPSMPGMNNGTQPQMPSQMEGTTMPGMQNGTTMPGMPGQNGMVPMTNVTYATEPSDIVLSDVTNTASALVADETNATVITMSDENNQVKITESGTYIVTGTCSDGNIVVKKGTTGVVLILKDLDLTSTTGATVSINKTAEAKIVIEGTVTLTDNEDPADEDSTDAEVADAYDGAALKVKDGANVYLTGTGALNINGNAKNGIKIGDADEPSFVIDGSLTINITASNDGINGGYDVTILSGTLNITAGDDAIHADRILTIGKDGAGPTITIKKCKEGLEGTVVNLFGGKCTISSTDDAINAANSDGTYASIGYSVNITGGEWTINSKADGIDSNGDVNIIGGTVTINAATVAGDAGIDYDGALYISKDAVFNNSSGLAGPDGMGMGMGMPGMGQMNMQNGPGAMVMS